jgi:nucleoid-associated protein YgaU
MTRETKIGLLVGLAFIIVIGILLSDYNRIDSPGAALVNEGSNVHQGVGSVGDSSKIDTIVYPPKPATPVKPVPTNDEMNRRAGGDEVVVRPFNGQMPATPGGNDTGSNSVVVAPGNSEPVNSQTPPNDLVSAAHERGMELVPVSPNNSKSNSPPAAGGSTLVAGKKYTALAGDTVSKMAGRFMGGNTQANRDAIQRANPTLAKNINNVVIGHVYIIPEASGSAMSAAPTTPAPTPVAARPQPAANAPVNQPGQTPTHWYVVKENDSLWKIAQEQLGDGGAVAAIKELNKDVLKGGENIRPNMKLKLPAKPLASAN